MVVQIANFCTTKLQFIKTRFQQASGRTFVICWKCGISIVVVCCEVSAWWIYNRIPWESRRFENEGLASMQVLHCLVGSLVRELAFAPDFPLNNAKGRPSRPSHFQTFAPDEGRRQGNAQGFSPSTIPSSPTPPPRNNKNSRYPS